LIALLLFFLLSTSDIEIEEPYVPECYQEVYNLYPSTFASVVFELPTYEQLGLSEEDYEFFARVVAAECNGDIDNDYANQVAIAQVVWNRVASPNFPDTVHDVLTQYGQFTTVKNGKCNKETNDLCRRAILEAYAYPLHPENIIYFNCVGFFHGHEAYLKISDNYFSYE
jgi:hypothetical protein